MKRIYKYNIKIEGVTTVMIPKNAMFLTLQTDQKDDNPVMWYLFDIAEPLEERMFTVVGTGYPLNDNLYPLKDYVGTFQIMLGEFVGHVFEIKGKDHETI